MSPAAETIPAAQSSQGRRPARRAAVWTLGVGLALTVFMGALSLLPSSDDSFAETSPALSVSRDEALMPLGYVALLLALLYGVLYVRFRLQGRSTR